MQWKSFIYMEIFDEQTTKTEVRHDCRLDLWRPRKFLIDNVVVHLSQFREELLIQKEKAVIKNNIIPIQAMSKLGKWIKVRGIPRRNWIYYLLRSVGKSLRGLVDIDVSTLQSTNKKNK